jgi:hypothetical protein
MALPTFSTSLPSRTQLLSTLIVPSLFNEYLAVVLEQPLSK